MKALFLDNTLKPVYNHTVKSGLSPLYPLLHKYTVGGNDDGCPAIFG